MMHTIGYSTHNTPPPDGLYIEQERCNPARQSEHHRTGQVERLHERRSRGIPTAEAAKKWDPKYTKLDGTVSQYGIRLSGGCRATFTVNTNTETVTMLQVGGHT